MNKRQNALRIKTTRGDCITRGVCASICLVFVAIFAIPILHVMISSLCYRGTWSLNGYGLLLKNKLVLSGFRNSLFLAVVGTLYSLCLEVPAAYLLSKRKYSALTGLFFMLGQFGIAILPLYLLLKQLNLLNTLWALILPCGLSIYYTQLLRARIINLTGELEDAASIDGASAITYIARILIPVLGPTLGCVAFFHVCSYWSSTLFAQTFLTDEAKYPLSVVLMELLIRNRSADVLADSASAVSVAAIQTAEYALCVLSAMPMIGIFLFMKKNIRTMETEGGTVL